MAGDRTLTMNQHEPKSSLRVATAAATDAGAILPPTHHAMTAEARAAAVQLSRPPISTVLVSGFARLIEFTAAALTGLIVYVFHVQPEVGLDGWERGAGIHQGAEDHIAADA